MNITKTFSTGIPKQKTDLILSLLNSWGSHLCKAIFYSDKPFSISVQVNDLGIFTSVENFVDEAESFIGSCLGMLMRVEKSERKIKEEVFDEFMAKNKYIKVKHEKCEDGIQIRMINMLNLNQVDHTIPDLFIYENDKVKISYLYNVLEEMKQSLVETKKSIGLFNIDIYYTKQSNFSQQLYFVNASRYNDLINSKPSVMVNLMNDNAISVKMYIVEDKEKLIENLRYIVKTVNNELSKVYGPNHLSFLHIPFHDVIDKIRDYYETEFGIQISREMIFNTKGGRKKCNKMKAEIVF